MRIVHTIIRTLLITGCLFCVCGTGYSQGTNLGTIRGTVTDQKGASVPGALVKVSDVATDISGTLRLTPKETMKRQVSSPALIAWLLQHRDSKQPQLLPP